MVYNTEPSVVREWPSLNSNPFPPPFPQERTLPIPNGSQDGEGEGVKKWRAEREGKKRRDQEKDKKKKDRRRGKKKDGKEWETETGSLVSENPHFYISKSSRSGKELQGAFLMSKPKDKKT